MTYPALIAARVAKLWAPQINATAKDVEPIIAEVIERCAKEAESRLQKKNDGRQCNCERCDEGMTLSTGIRRLATDPTP